MGVELGLSHSVAELEELIEKTIKATVPLTLAGRVSETIENTAQERLTRAEKTELERRLAATARILIREDPSRIEQAELERRFAEIVETGVRERLTSAKKAELVRQLSEAVVIWYIVRS